MRYGGVALSVARRYVLAPILAARATSVYSVLLKEALHRRLRVALYRRARESCHPLNERRYAAADKVLGAKPQS